MKKAKSLTFPPLEAGRTLGGRYELVREIGRGPRGMVYEAKDLDFEEWPVALKILPQEFAAKSTLLTKLKECAQDAIQIIHENVIRLHDVEYVDGIAFIVMQLLQPFVIDPQNKPAKLPFAEVCHIAQSAVSGLSAAHRLGVFHGAIKPANLMWNNERILKLAEVGTLCNVSETKSPYVAPERFRGESPSALADQYSLAATLESLLDEASPACAKEAIERAKSELPEQRYDDIETFLVAFLGPNWSPTVQAAQMDAKKVKAATEPIVTTTSATELQALYIGDDNGPGQNASSTLSDSSAASPKPSLMSTIIMLAILPIWLLTLAVAPSLAILISLIMSLWVAFDAYGRTSTISRDLLRGKKIWGTWSWFFGTVLLFPLVYPAYLFKRRAYAELQSV